MTHDEFYEFKKLGQKVLKLVTQMQAIVDNSEEYDAEISESTEDMLAPVLMIFEKFADPVDSSVFK